MIHELLRPSIESVELVDKFTVRVFLKLPSPSFLQFLAVDYMQIVPKHVVEAGVHINMNVYIRHATVDDVSAIAKIHVDSWRTTYKGIVPDDFLAGLSYGQREVFWRQRLTEPSRTGFVYVAEDGHGQVVGFVSGGPERSGDTLYSGELYAIYLLASYQGQGLGRQLTSTLVNRLIQEDMSALLIWVLASNPSCKFYERLGGQPVKEKTVTIGGMPLVEIAYGWPDAHTITRCHRRNIS